VCPGSADDPVKDTAARYALLLMPMLCASCNSYDASSPTRPSALNAVAEGPPTSRPVYPSTGPALVAFVAERHPDRLAADVSADERVANMEFLRDQVIAAGICGGLDLARNLKRGVGPHSIDAIAWRHPDGGLDVVDIAAAYDDTGRHLRLHWIVVDGPAGWDPIAEPSCPQQGS